MKKLLLLLAVILCVTEESFSQSQKYSRVKIFTQGKNLQELSRAGVCIDHGDSKKGFFFISDFSEKEIEIIRQKGFSYEIQIDDVQKYYNEQNNPSSEKYVPVPAPMTHGCNSIISYLTPANFSLGSMGGFFTYQEIQNKLDSMAILFPNLVKAKAPLDSLTIEGRPVYWMKISDNPNVDETEPEMLYTAVHHAREPASVSQLIMYMYYLLENYSTNTEVKYLVDNLEMYFIPVVNPDGYIYNETTNPNGGGMWRKNRRDNMDGEWGVDLNRNYGYNWGFDNNGSDPNTSSDTYRGDTLFSEPETQNTRNFCNAHQFKLTLNYHTYGNLLIYPWGYQPSIYTPDSAQFVEYAKYLTYQNHYNYGTANQTVEYVVNGSSDDWMYGEQTSKGKILAMTPEAGDAANGFWPPQNLITSICKENITQNLHAAHLLLKHAIATDEEPRYISAQNGFFNYNIKCLGMDAPATFTVTVIPVSPEITSIGAPKVYSNMNLLQGQNDSISFTISGSASNAQVLQYILSVTNGQYTRNDTIEKIYGAPTILFSSNGNSMTGWTSSTGWGVDNNIFYSPTGSIADSPGSNYNSNDSTRIRTTSQINMTGVVRATLSFRARWEVEPRFDYVEVQASADNGNTWTPLCGKYSKPGNAYQDYQQPIYDGFMFPWVREEIILDNYANQNLLIRFMLKSDWGNEYDGFFFDDLKLEVLQTTNAVSEIGNEIEFSVSPNPASSMIAVIASGAKQSLIICNLLGEKVGSQQLAIGKNEIDISNLHRGVYFVKVTDENGSFGVKKIVVQ